MSKQHEIYRDHVVYYDPPPIPIRTVDWHYYHKDYDGEGDNRHGDGPSAEDCKAQIDDWWAEKDGLSESEQRDQAKRCACAGTDDLCACQNVADTATIRNRRGAQP